MQSSHRFDATQYAGMSPSGSMPQRANQTGTRETKSKSTEPSLNPTTGLHGESREDGDCAVVVVVAGQEHLVERDAHAGQLVDGGLEILVVGRKGLRDVATCNKTQTERISLRPFIHKQRSFPNNESSSWAEKAFEM